MRDPSLWFVARDGHLIGWSFYRQRQPTKNRVVGPQAAAQILVRTSSSRR